MKILFIEDDQILSNNLSSILKNESYDVTCAYDGKSAIQLCKNQSFDIFLLDYNLPDMNGLDIFSEYSQMNHLKKAKTVFFSSNSDEDFQIKVLQECADDYIIKPVSSKLLVTKLNKIAKKEPQDHASWHITFDPTNLTATLGNVTVELTRTEYGILKLLNQNVNKPVKRDDVITVIRGDGFSVTPRIIDFQICNLRKKMDKYGEFLETVRGVGYKLTRR